MNEWHQRVDWWELANFIMLINILIALRLILAELKKAAKK